MRYSLCGSQPEAGRESQQAVSARPLGEGQRHSDTPGSWSARFCEIASPTQGVGYFEKGGCYAKDDGAHDKAVSATLGWIEANAILETRMRDPATGAKVRAE